MTNDVTVRVRQFVTPIILQLMEIKYLEYFLRVLRYM